ncbi:MAG: TolC family protein [Muribaculaceae bacterium]|nr:TolC family protein [Muribaculaceae bacterium]
MKIKSIISILCLVTSMSLNALELSLQECREMALQNDEDIRIAQNHIIQANLDKGIARSAFFPKFDINGGAFYLTPNPSMGAAMEMQMRGVYMAGISLTQPIYTGGKIITGNKLARIGQKVSQDQYEAIRMDIVAEAEKSYWMYVAVLSKIDMINSYITQLDSIFDYTLSAYELGFTTELNVKRVESRRSELQYNLKQAETGADLCRMAICRIIGVEENEPVIPTENIETLGEPNDKYWGIENRPEVSLLERNIEAKKLDVKMALSDFLPTVGMQIGWNAFGNMKMTSYTPLEDGSFYPFTQSIDYRGFVGAVSVSIPVFHWGEGYKKVKKAKFEVENAILSHEKNRKLMELQSRQAYNNYITGYELITTANKALNEAKSNLNAITEQYQVGLMTLTDLLEAQSQWQSSYSNLIEAKTQFKINEVNYLRSVGML